MTTYTPWRTARYPGTCRRCPERIEVGFTIYHIPRNRVTLCRRCGLRAEAKLAEESEKYASLSRFSKATQPKAD